MAIVLSHADCIKLSVERLSCAPEFGGIPVQFGLSGNFFDPLSPVLEAINNLVGQLGPLKPLLDLLMLVIQIVKCIQSIPDAILSLDPSGIINCVPKLVELLTALLALIPPFSLFKTVAGFLCLIVSFLAAIIAFLQWIRDSAVDIGVAFAQNLDLEDVNLSAIISCGNANLLGMLDEISGLFELIAVLLAIYNLFADLAGLDPIELPSLAISGSAGTTLQPTYLDPVIEALTATKETLHDVLRAIPTGLSMA